MNVSYGSKIKNLMAFALKKMKEPEIKQITWNGSGNGISKVISCCEIMKRKIKGLHQITNIRFKRIEEFWEPKLEGLERLKVNKDIPAITILLSQEPLDETHPGYQAPGSFEAFWKKTVTEDLKNKSKNVRDSRRSGTPNESKNDNSQRKRRKNDKGKPGGPQEKHRGKTPGGKSTKQSKDISNKDKTTEVTPMDK